MTNTGDMRVAPYITPTVTGNYDLRVNDVTPYTDAAVNLTWPASGETVFGDMIAIMEISAVVGALVTILPNGNTVENPITLVLETSSFIIRANNVNIEWIKLRDDVWHVYRFSGPLNPVTLIEDTGGAGTILDNTLTQLSFSNVVLDNAGQADLANDRIVLVRAGVNTISAALHIIIPSVGGTPSDYQVELGVFLNASLESSDVINFTSRDCIDMVMEADALTVVAATDIVTAFVLSINSSGNDLEITSDGTQLFSLRA